MPERLGRYDIVRELGRGAMGVVYLAEDRLLGRQVALKVLPSTEKSAALRDRLIREARVCARLDHPGVIRLHDIGHDDGVDFLVMEYVTGRTLAAFLLESETKPPMTQRDAAVMFMEMLEGVEHAHKLGIVHRDLKPANIMVTREGHTKIMDFGLAWQQEQAQLTRAGAVMGTLAYFSPEQARGERANERSDLYSLGAIFFEMLTGRMVFEADTAAAMIFSHLQAPPPKLGDFLPDAAPELDSLIQKCLQKEAADRYPSARPMLQELEAFVRGRPVATARVGSWSVNGGAGPTFPVSAAAPSSPAPKAAGGPPFPLPAAGVGSPPFSAVKGAAYPNPPGAGCAPAQAGGAPAFPFPASGAGTPSFPPPRAGGAPLFPLPASGTSSPPYSPQRSGSAPPFHVPAGGMGTPSFSTPKAGGAPTFPVPASAAGTPPFSAPTSGATAPRGTPSAKPAPDFRVTSLMSRSSLDGSTPWDAKSTHVPDPEPAPGKETVAPPPEPRAMTEQEALVARGVEAYRRGDREQARRDLQAGLALLPMSLDAHLFLGRLDMDEQALDTAETSLLAARRISPRDPRALNDLARLYQFQGRHMQAIEACRQSLVLAAENPSIRCRLGALLVESGKVGEGIAEYERCVASNPDYLPAWRSLAKLYADHDRAGDAIRACETVTNLDPTDLETLRSLVRHHGRARNHAGMEKACNAALPLAPQDAGLHRELATALDGLGRHEAALQALEKAVTLEPTCLEAQERLAAASLRARHPRQARAVMERGLEHCPKSSKLYLLLADLCCMEGQGDQACDYFERGLLLDARVRSADQALGALEIPPGLEAACCRDAVRRKPGDPMLRAVLALSEYSQDKVGAAQEMARAASLDPRNGDYCRMLGLMWEGAGRPDEALHAMKRAVELSPLDPVVHGLLGRMYLRQGLHDLAAPALKRALELDRGSFLMHFHLGRARRGMGQSERAVRSFRRCVDIRRREDAGS